MQTIVVANPKGGAGKTTLAINLGAQLALDEATCLMDFDPQGTLTKWHKRRMNALPESTLHRAVPVMSQVRQSLANLASTYDKVIVDTRPGMANVELDTLVALADVLLIPCRPSLADVEAVLPLVSIAKTHRTPFAFVINSVRPNAKQTAQTIAVLSKHGAVDENFLGDRTIFMDTLPAGLVPREVRRTHKAAVEVSALTLSIHDMLEARNG